MMKRITISFFGLILLIMAAVPSITKAQGPGDEWQIPYIACDSENCVRQDRVDEVGNLYIYVERFRPSRQKILYVIERNTNQVIEYDMMQIYPGRGAQRDFVPFANNKLVIFDYQADIPLALLDLQSKQAVSLSVNIQGTVEQCNIFSFMVPTSSIYRVGNNKVLFCSRNQGISFINLAHLDNNTLVTEHTFEMGGSTTPERYTPPWLDITNSLDGKIYFIAWPGTPILRQLAPQFTDSYDGSDYLVLSYAPDLRTWSTVKIQNSTERWQEGEQTSSLASFVGVDGAGNLYFWHNAYTSAGLHISNFVKYSPQGEKLWHLTESDFDGRNFTPLLIAEDQFILIFANWDLQYYALTAPPHTEG